VRLRVRCGRAPLLDLYADLWEAAAVAQQRERGGAQEANEFGILCTRRTRAEATARSRSPMPVAAVGLSGPRTSGTA
jgi:hypothetical protein